jgi:hypothetical protein
MSGARDIVENISFNADLIEHARWTFKHIYSHPYPGTNPRKNDIARVYHGIQHVSRVAIYIPIFANLYQRYGDSEALNLTADDLKLLQIAALFHDSARQGDGEDLWYKESSELFQDCALNQLKLSEEKVAAYANAIANKDSSSQKNILQKLIHDADCIDIIRARAVFQAEYLDFYQLIAIHNAQAFDEMAFFIAEVRSLIALQGDTYDAHQFKVKNKFNDENAYSNILPLIHENTDAKIKYKIIPYFYNAGKLFSAEQLKKSFTILEPIPDGKLTEEKAQRLMEHGNLFSRSVQYPAANSALYNKTLGGLEAKFAVSNKHRSISLLGYGAASYGRCGFLLMRVPAEITIISAVDIDSGFQEKNYWVTSTPLLNDAAKKHELSNLLRNLKMGGKSRSIKNTSRLHLHTEIVATINSFDGVYYSVDSSADSVTTKPEALLEAIFLQREYPVPIFQYSRTHNRITLEKTFSHDDIKDLWAKACRQYVGCTPHNYLNTSTADLKILCISGSTGTPFRYQDLIKKLGSADANYPAELQSQISEVIEINKKALIDAQLNSIRQKILSDKSILDISIREMLLYPSIFKQPEVINKLAEKIYVAISEDLVAAHFPKAPKTIFEIYNGYANGDDFTKKLLSEDKELLLINNCYASPLQYTISKIYILALKLQLSKAVNIIRQQAREYFRNELEKAYQLKEYPHYKELISIAATFDFFLECRKDILKLFSKFGQCWRPEEVLDMILIPAQEFTMEEAYYYKILAGYYSIAENKQKEVLGKWFDNKALEAFVPSVIGTFFKNNFSKVVAEIANVGDDMAIAKLGKI